MRGRPGGLLQLAIGFLPSDADAGSPGPVMQHGQTEISVDDVKCHCAVYK